MGKPLRGYGGQHVRPQFHEIALPRLNRMSAGPVPGFCTDQFQRTPKTSTTQIPSSRVGFPLRCIRSFGRLVAPTGARQSQHFGASRNYSGALRPTVGRQDYCTRAPAKSTTYGTSRHSFQREQHELVRLAYRHAKVVASRPSYCRIGSSRLSAKSGPTRQPNSRFRFS